MAQTVLITLTTAGADTGPFDLYSDADGFVTPFETGISKAALQAGYLSTVVPDAATQIRVQSDGVCTNNITLNIQTTTTTTTTSTTTSTTSTTTTTTSSTTTTTTTEDPGPFFYSAYNQICGVSECQDTGAQVVVQSPIILSVGYYSEGNNNSIVYRIISSTTGPADYTFTDPQSRASNYCCS